MEEQIREILVEKVNPILEKHYGGAVLTAFENKIAYVRLIGACGTCPSAQYTIEDVVKDIVIKNCEGVDDVQLDTSVSPDLLEMARKILCKSPEIER